MTRFAAVLALLPCGCSGDKGGADGDGDGFAIDDGDCDDADPKVHPGAADPPYDGVDANCDDLDDFDADRDGYSASGDVDCDDADPAVHPGAEEHCDGIDEDCGGDGDDGAVDAVDWYVDADEDGVGSGVPTRACGGPAGSVAAGDDCDDADPTVFPGAPPVACDGLDNDCDGVVAEVGRITLSDGTEFADLGAAAAAAGYPETISLCEGAYPASGVALGSVAIEGTYGSAVTLLVGDGSGPVLRSEGAEVVVTGVTVSGGAPGIEVADTYALSLFSSSVRDNHGAGGVRLGAGAHALLVGTTVGDNTGEVGGGLYLADGASLTLQGATVSGNTATASGGGIGGGAAVTVDGVGGSEISGNTAADGGGVGIVGGTLLGLTLDGNSASGRGGGLWAEGVVFVTATAITANDAADGGGIAVGQELWCTGCAVDANVATGRGGGIYAYGGVPADLGQVDLVASSITANTGGDGGGAWVVEAVTHSDATDWGVDASDNVPIDLTMGSTGQSYPGVFTFTCTYTGDAVYCS
jgi:hypothetical protein